MHRAASFPSKRAVAVSFPVFRSPLSLLINLDSTMVSIPSCPPPPPRALCQFDDLDSALVASVDHMEQSNLTSLEAASRDSELVVLQVLVRAGLQGSSHSCFFSMKVHGHTTIAAVAEPSHVQDYDGRKNSFAGLGHVFFWNSAVPHAFDWRSTLVVAPSKQSRFCKKPTDMACGEKH